jgi:hypothetical protein
MTYLEIEWDQIRQRQEARDLKAGQHIAHPELPEPEVCDDMPVTLTDQPQDAP